MIRSTESSKKLSDSILKNTHRLYNPLALEKLFDPRRLEQGAAEKGVSMQSRFDMSFGDSAGVANSLYFFAGQTKTLGSIYFEEFSN